MSGNPLSLWWDMVRLPLSGDVNQRNVTSWLSPNMTVNYGGNFEIERRVVSDVASFGKQIGWLSEIVDKLADGHPAPKDALDKLREAMKKIAAIKEQVRQSAEDEAAEALDRLEKEDPEGVRTFLERRVQKLPTKDRARKGTPGKDSPRTSS
ncbi:MAG TPA: hypothetical protein VF744_03040 [Beijerinckiaceae bacterium]|jgi:hypothetical protein